MKTTSLTLWAVSAGFTLATPTATDSADASSTSASDEPSCTAELIATLCNYKDPFRAVASSGKNHCWSYCDENQPCDFTIWLAGNPHLGTGTCWVYPGESFDPSQGQESDCGDDGWGELLVYGKPTCAGTPTEPEACSATNSPSAVAEICDYPAPETCFETCYASSGAPNCLELCGKDENCEYAVFNPRGETNSPFEPGTCWVYREGEYDPKQAGTCGSEGPQQYVYENVCPDLKPSKTPSATTSAAKPTSTPSGNQSDDSDDQESNEGEDSDTVTNGASADEVKKGSGGGEGGDSEEGAASTTTALSFGGLLAMALAMLF